MGGRLAGMAVAALLATPAAALAHSAPGSLPGAGPPSSCGTPIAADHQFLGTFTTADQGSYVYVPFDVPAGTTQIRARLCWTDPETPASSQIRHTIDLGLYESRPEGDALWGPAEFRGWGGSSRLDARVSPEFDATTRGFRAGPIPPGQWAAELGVAAVVPRSQGDVDGTVAWRLEVDLADDPALADEPYVPAPYDSSPRGGAGWYAGDVHVHAEHSSLKNASMRETFDYAFTPLAAGGAGLDFITLSDYVSDTAWGEIGRHQPDHPTKLIARSAEVITYRGHVNNHGSARFVDYRTGPLYEWVHGKLVKKRGATGPNGILDAIHAAGGYTQINHPTTFPATVPPFALLCRGCSWEYPETDYSKVDAIEVATGPAGLAQPPKPGPNPFTPLAIQFWEDVLARGHRIAAVGSSDSHNAGRTPGGITQSPIGQATTVVYADELSEDGIQRGIEARRTYVKMYGNDGPDLRFTAHDPETGEELGMMGDAVEASLVDLSARVMRAAPAIGGSKPGAYQLVIVRDGVAVATFPITGADQTFELPGVGPGRYRLQVQRGQTIEAVSSPIWLE